MVAYLLLLVGFVLLIKGADFFVEGASRIATMLRVPPLLIGLTIVSFGTSSPEASVSILAAIEGNSDVTLGNVLGSNIFNITFVIGLTAMLNPLKVENTTIQKEIPFTFLASLALLVLMSDVSLQFFNDNMITRGDGLIFLLFFSIFMYYIFEVARNSRSSASQDNEMKIEGSWGKNIFLSVSGLVGIIFGGDLVVDNSLTIAYSLGMSETLAGLTIVAVGTSLPELITSVTAAYKKLSEIALGNIVGSNIFNILFVLGTSSLFAPLPVNQKLLFDIVFMIVLTVILFLFSRSHYRVGKAEGGILAIAYVMYMVFIIMRN